MAYMSPNQDKSGWIAAWERSKQIQRDLRSPRLCSFCERPLGATDIGRHPACQIQVDAQMECPAEGREWRCKLPKGHDGPCEDA